MKLRAPVFEITPEDPFKNDLLGRKVNAELLTELLKTVGEPLVLCIDAPWGEGKTTFLKMWRQQLNQQNFRTLYFSAWENDFSDNALISLIGELRAGIKQLTLNKSKLKSARKHLDQITKTGATLVKRSIPIAIKMATAGALDIEEAIESGLGEIGEKLAQEQIDNYEAAKQGMITFRDELSGFSNSIAVSDSEERSLPLVILIDELDRCRPLFAIEVLEKAKHFFNVPNIIFVLAVDKEQLSYSIQSIYGAIEVDGYLRRFMDIEYTLPLPDIESFCEAQFERFGLNEYFSGTNTNKASLTEMLTGLFQVFNCTLRQQEACFSLLSVAVRTTPTGEQLYPIALGILIVLKISKGELYKEFIQRKSSAEEVIEFIREQRGGIELLNNRTGLLIEVFLHASSKNLYDLDKLGKQWQKELDVKEISEENASRLRRLLDLLDYPDIWKLAENQNALFKKIDMISNFSSR